MLDESIAQGIQQEAPERGTPTGRPHADRALDQACGRLPTLNTNTVHSRQATSIQYHLIGLNEKTNLKQKKPSRRNGRLAGHEEIVSNSISAQACLPADRPSTVHRKYSGRDRSSLCLFMDCMVCWFHPPAGASPSGSTVEVLRLPPLSTLFALEDNPI